MAGIHDEAPHVPTLAWLRSQRQAILAIAARYGVTNLRVFGSVARDEAGPDSDIDLLISVPPHTPVFELVGLFLDLQDLLGRPVSLVPDTADAPGFMARINADVVPL